MSGARTGDRDANFGVGCDVVFSIDAARPLPSMGVASRMAWRNIDASSWLSRRRQRGVSDLFAIDQYDMKAARTMDADLQLAFDIAGAGRPGNQRDAPG